MRVELLLVEECPHAAGARTLLARCLAEMGLDLAVVERVGDYPSPTVLVDGIDVMTGAAGTPRMSACRMDVPTEAAVATALAAAIRTSVPGDVNGYPADLAVGVTRDRITRVSPAARTLHKAILRGFSGTGHAPDRAALAAATPAGSDLTTLLAELHEHDVVRIGENARIVAAYPYSGVPTAHIVAIDAGPSVYAMCAIDALGIHQMLGRDTTVTSTDPACGQQIEVRVIKGHAVWTPDTTVVFVGSHATAQSTGGDCCPPQADQACVIAAAERCCGVMNFFANTDSANTWLAANTDVAGVILTQPQALRLGVDIFGRLLDD